MTKTLTVISGKGGSGKTTITASLIALANNPVIVDADVDASDMHLLLGPEVVSKETFLGMDIAVKDESKCINCGKCYRNCRYGAFDIDNTYHPDKCEGCGVCELVCPTGAMTMTERVSGEAFVSTTRFGPMVHARLKAGEESSGKLVALVRKRAQEVAKKEGRELIIVDGPPGIGCTVISAITGADLVLTVIEPTLSGIHDSKRIIEVARHFGVPVVACINKSDINPDNTGDITAFCKAENIPLIGVLPYDETAVKAMMREQTVVEYGGPLSESIRELWKRLSDHL